MPLEHPNLQVEQVPQEDKIKTKEGTSQEIKTTDQEDLVLEPHNIKEQEAVPRPEVQATGINQGLHQAELEAMEVPQLEEELLELPLQEEDLEVRPNLEEEKLEALG